MARVLAAAVMNLVKDPTGSRLPPEVWRLLLPKADAVLFIITNGRAPYAPFAERTSHGDP